MEYGQNRVRSGSRSNFSLLRYGFLSLMMLIELKRLPQDLNLLTIPAMVVGVVEQRYLDCFSNRTPDSLHELINLYNTTSSNTLDLHAPVVTKTIKSRPLVPWYCVDIKEARRERRKAERKWRRTRCCSDLLAFKVVRNSFPFSIPAELYERLTRL